MPAINPRLTITLKPSVQAVIQRLSTLTGESQSSLVAGILDQSTPVLKRMVQVFEAAAQAKTVLDSQMAESMERAHAKIEDQLGLALDAWDEAAQPLIEAAEAITRRTGKGGGGGRVRSPRTASAPALAGAVGVESTPVPVTRGSGSPQRPKTARKGAARGPL